MTYTVRYKFKRRKRFEPKRTFVEAKFADKCADSLAKMASVSDVEIICDDGYSKETLSYKQDKP